MASSPHVASFVRRSKVTGEACTFHLIGTAHVSKKSVDEVRETIAALRPDTVCVELCPTRYAALTDPSRFRSLDVPAIIAEGRAGFTLATLALQAFQKRIGDRLGVRPGAELLAATEAAKEVGATLVLADRDAQITLRRAWSNLGPLKRAVVLVGLFASALQDDAIDEDQIEQLKQRDHVSDVMGELGKKLPEVKVPLIDERDLYLTSHLEEARGKTVVAVVGAGHVEGMLASLGKSVDRPALEVLPRASLFEHFRGFSLQALALAAAVIAFRHGVAPFALATAWALPVMSALLATLVAARARLETQLVGLIVSPWAALLPGVSGRVFGGLEAALRKPSAEDGARVGHDVTSMRAALANAATRSLLVAVAADYGVALGRAVASGWLLALAATH